VLLRRAAFAAALLARVFSTPLEAQSPPPRYVAKAWQTGQGLPQNSVYEVVQDREGYLWLATWGGLVRFDGARFTVFGMADIPGLGSSRILSLHASRSGGLWIGTRDGGLARLDDGVATSYEGDPLRRTPVTSIREDAEGRVWINTPLGTARVAGTKLEPYVSHRGKPVGEFYLQARDGSLWFHSGSDIVRFGADGASATLPVGKPSGFLVHEARDGSVLIASNDQPRLVRYDQGVFSDVQLPPARLRQYAAFHPHAGVLAMATDTDGELLLLTPTGLARVADARLRPVEALPVPGNGGELPKALSLLVDREGNRWIGTLTTGLHRFRPAPVTAYGREEGLSDTEFFSVFQDRDGRIWLGGRLLYWFDGQRFHRFPGLVDVRAIAQSRDGDLWFGGSGGLYRWRSGVLSRFRIDAPAVSVILQDRQGTLWIVAPTYERPGGLYRFREGHFERVAGDVHNIAEDRNGGLWVASPRGLERVRGDDTVLYEQNLSSVPAMDQDPTGTLWIADYGRGLFRLRDGRLKAITTRDGLPNNLPVAILRDGADLWISSDHNILRVGLEQLNDLADGRASSISPVSYGLAEGMRTSECNSGSPGAWKAADGRIWFPTLRGVVAIDPGVGNRLPPPVVVEEAWAHQLKLGRSGRTSIPPGNNTVDFRFTALTFSAPEKARFRYRLDPYDEEWVEGGPGRAAHYTNLDPGEYSFHVIAANDYGVWNEQGASVRFVLQPRYYQTAWFRALCGMILVILLWAAYQVRVRQLRQQFERTLNARVDERTRIARELHDTLLQGAHGILLRFQTVAELLPGRPTEAKARLDTAIEQAAHFVTEARDEVKGLRSSTVQSNDLPRAIGTLGEELATDSTTEGSTAFRVGVEGNARDLHPIVRDEIYKIAAEALRNAFRHAQARQVEVEIRYADEELRLRVRDDGSGIDSAVLAAKAHEGHYGLRGMTERANAIGGHLAVWSELRQGTEVELRVPARAAYAAIPRRGWFSRAARLR
jgi:signal transduction histidine kinase/ligand-binding sensor domain-containing protein